MKPLPVRRFEPSTWKKAKMHIDDHVEFEARFYSAPHHLIGTKLWVRATVTTIELVLDGRRVASHTRRYGHKGAYVIADTGLSRTASTARGRLSESSIGPPNSASSGALPASTTHAASVSSSAAAC